MLDDITTTIKAQLYERATSPLLGSFIISWCVINYKVILIIFSSLAAPEKITYINMNLFASTNDYLIKGAFGPLLAALALILIYPYPAAWIYRISRNHQKQLKSIRQLIDDETPLTVQESRTLRLESIQQQIKLESEVERYTNENRGLKSIIENHNPAYANLEKSTTQAIREKDEAIAKLSDEQQKTKRLDELLEQVIKYRKNHPDSALDIEELKKQIFISSSPTPQSNMQADNVRSQIKRRVEEYIADIKPFGNISSTVEITNDRLFTNYQTPDGLNVKDWGKISTNDFSSSALRVMGDLRNYRDKNGS